MILFVGMTAVRLLNETDTLFQRRRATFCWYPVLPTLRSPKAADTLTLWSGVGSELEALGFSENVRKSRGGFPLHTECERGDMC